MHPHLIQELFPDIGVNVTLPGHNRHFQQDIDNRTVGGLSPANVMFLLKPAAFGHTFEGSCNWQILLTF